MTRRNWTGLAMGWLAGAAAWAEEARASLRGKLAPGSPARLLAAPEPVELSGDDPTMAVLADPRLAGADFEAAGSLTAPGKFRVDQIHKRNMFVHKDGRKLMISYWCEVCSIRTWAPGKCMCCQDDTALDLKESFETVK